VLRALLKLPIGKSWCVAKRMMREDAYVLDGEMLTMKIQKTGQRTVKRPNLHSEGSMEACKAGAVLAKQ
jgi:hypothetical protein